MEVHKCSFLSSFTVYMYVYLRSVAAVGFFSQFPFPPPPVCRFFFFWRHRQEIRSSDLSSSSSSSFQVDPRWIFHARLLGKTKAVAGVSGEKRKNPISCSSSSVFLLPLLTPTDRANEKRYRNLQLPSFFAPLILPFLLQIWNPIVFSDRKSRRTQSLSSAPL